MKFTNYSRSIKYLESFIGQIRYRIDKEFIKHHDPLERMRVLLDLLGNPQNKFPSVLVGGTSGKGSTAYLISHILTTAGYKTGLTISPHLEKVNERLQINGEQISNQEFTQMVSSIVRTIELMRRMEVGAPSYFEILVAMAFLYFAKQKVDIAVVEVGMGGEFDATNTLNPLIAVLTNVDLDHTNVLGKTVEKIARTKAGIIKIDKQQATSNKNKLIVISGVKQPSVIRIVEDKCKKIGAKLYRLHKDFNYKIKKESLGGSIFHLTTARGRVLQLNNLELALLGTYQIENASLAIETTLQLRKFGFKISEENIRKSLKKAFFPARFEVIPIRGHIALGSPRQFDDSSSPVLPQSENLARAYLSKIDSKDALFKSSSHAKAPRATISSRLLLPNSQFSILNSQLILDGAHNPTKMKEFLKSLKKNFPKQKKIFVVGFKFDKNIKNMLKEIIKVADKIIITEFRAKTDMRIHASAEALNLKPLIFNLKSDAKVTVEKDSKKALKIGLKAIQQYNSSTILVVTGSLYLVGEIRNML